MPDQTTPTPHLTPSGPSEPPRLPLRWGVILAVTLGTAAVVFLAEGPVAAITLAVATSGALHMILD